MKAIVNRKGARKLISERFEQQLLAEDDDDDELYSATLAQGEDDQEYDVINKPYFQPVLKSQARRAPAAGNLHRKTPKKVASGKPFRRSVDTEREYSLAAPPPHIASEAETRLRELEARLARIEEQGSVREAVAGVKKVVARKMTRMVTEKGIALSVMRFDYVQL